MACNISHRIEPIPEALKTCKAIMKVFNFICGKGGEVEVSELTSPPSPLQGLSSICLDMWLKWRNKEAENNENFVFVYWNGNRSVRVILKTYLCVSYEQGFCKSGNSCTRWHICKGFLEGSCTGTHCDKSHDFLDKDNRHKAECLKVDRLPNVVIKKLVLKSLPSLCESYIRGEICHDCLSVHLCPAFLAGECVSQHLHKSKNWYFAHNIKSFKNTFVYNTFQFPSKLTINQIKCNLIVPLELQGKKCPGEMSEEASATTDTESIKSKKSGDLTSSKVNQQVGSSNEDEKLNKALKLMNVIASKGGSEKVKRLLQSPSPLQSHSFQQLKECIETLAANSEKGAAHLSLCGKPSKPNEVQIVFHSLMCSYYLNGNCSQGENCPRWHICKGYIEGQCSNKNNCPKSHNFHDIENIKKTEKFNLKAHPSGTIRKLVSLNMPHICEQYVAGKCDEKCSGIHACPGFVIDECADGNCQLSHDIKTRHNQAVFKSHGVPPTLIVKFLKSNILVPQSLQKQSLSDSQSALNDLNLLGSGQEGKSSVNTQQLHTMNIDDSELSPDDNDECDTQKQQQIRQRGKKNDGKAKGTKRDADFQPKNAPKPLMNIITANPTKLPDLPGVRGRGRGGGPGRESKGRGGYQGSRAAPSGGSSGYSVENEKQPRGRRWRRTRGRKKQHTSDEGSNAAENPPECETFQDDDNLIDFSDEDNKLVDLDDFEYVDHGLSQYSDYAVDASPLIPPSGAEKSSMSTNNSLADDLFSLDLSQGTSSFDFSLSQDSEDSVSNPSTNFQGLEKQVFDCLIKIYGGTASFSALLLHTELLPPPLESTENWLRRRHSSFLLKEDENGDILEVTAISLKARMCFQHLSRSGECKKFNCPYLHICKEYVANDECSFGATCKRNHSFQGEHNQKVVAALNLDGLTDEQLRLLVQASQIQVCLDHNKKQCKAGKKCNRIHVCKKFIQRKCRRKNCFFMHEGGLKSLHTKAVLRRFKRKVPQDSELFRVMGQVLVCDDTSADAADDGDDDILLAAEEGGRDEKVHIHAMDINAEICPNFLLGKCKDGVRCSLHHCPTPYQWIYRGDKSWQDDWHAIGSVDNMRLEKLYSDPKIQQAKLKVSLDLLETNDDDEYLFNFQLMVISVYGKHDIACLKRLSTGSSVYFPPIESPIPLATTWVWYWKENDSVFMEYVPKEGKGPDSRVLEMHFQDGDKHFDFLCSNGYNYRIFFKRQRMYQQNLDNPGWKLRRVVRRPKIIGTKDFKEHQSKAPIVVMTSPRQVPPHWKPMPDAQELCLVELESDSSENKDVQRHFMSSMRQHPGKVKVQAISRVQNPELWENFIRKKSQMSRKTKGEVEQRRLFRGTSAIDIRNTCRENFDWRSDVNETGNMYGEGAYFAKSALTGDQYSTADEDGLQYMFVVDALVGDYTEGEPSYRKPPRKDSNNPSSDLFDSCVDDVQHPEVFVMFDLNQYYPSYLIEYKVTAAAASTANTGGAALSLATGQGIGHVPPSISSLHYPGSTPTYQGGSPAYHGGNSSGNISSIGNTPPFLGSNTPYYGIAPSPVYQGSHTASSGSTPAYLGSAPSSQGGARPRTTAQTPRNQANFHNTKKGESCSVM
ncbi:uncharacterized protein LOC5516216 isoform X2 [Nematostella vectensis]|uniref:uncharacterized protein LOC5516216 isoform X2 n=1 Tax=Nematostella vectensis TaxID=45351 RepID=UPI00138FAA02|nr:uncharacterized protein LOC5516216 isoform X2 [Nematostella vectensis]